MIMTMACACFLSIASGVVGRRHHDDPRTNGFGALKVSPVELALLFLDTVETQATFCSVDNYTSEYCTN
jgi:hypothetical protein